MLHEFCHRNAHRDPRLNYLIGWITSTLFGTAPTFLRVQHWGHHRRNRTEAERAEFIHEGESPVEDRDTTRRSSAASGWAVSSFRSSRRCCPTRPLSGWRVTSASTVSLRASASSARATGEGCRSKVSCSSRSGAACVWFGPWHWQTLAIAYAAFAFTWSSLQWIYHMHTPVHVVEGAYNLRAPGSCGLFLNFNYNLTHHRRPSLPWQELHARSDPQETQPLWYRYLLVFRPPVHVPERSLGAREALLLRQPMRLADLVARYPNTRLATPADNARILDFFERTPMHTSAFDVQYPQAARLLQAPALPVGSRLRHA